MMRGFWRTHAPRKRIFIALLALAASCVLLLLCGLVAASSLRTRMTDTVVAEAASPDGAFYARVIYRLGESMVPDSARVVVTDRSGSGNSTSGDEKAIEFKRPIVHNVYWIDERTLVVEYDDYYALFPNGFPPWHGVTFVFRGTKSPSN